MQWAASILLAAGGLICFLNFYLVFLRYPVYRLVGGNPAEYRFTSGVPLVGSLLVALSLIVFWSNPWLAALALLLMLIDIDGLHWYILMYIYFEVLRKRRTPSLPQTQK